MDTDPSEPESTNPGPPRSSPTSDAQQDTTKPNIVSSEVKSHIDPGETLTQGFRSRGITDDRHLRIYTSLLDKSSILSLPIKNAQSSGLNGSKEPGSGHELLIVADSAKYVPTENPNFHSVKSSKIYAVLDTTESTHPGEPAMKHQISFEDLSCDSASVQTFQTAPTTFRTYVTAQSIVSDNKNPLDNPLNSPFDHRLDFLRYRKKAYEDIQKASRDLSNFESLVTAIVRTLELHIRQRASEVIQATTRKELLRLCDPSDTIISLNSFIADFLPRIEQACSDSNVTFDQQYFADTIEHFIWEYAVKQPDLGNFLRKSLSSCKTFGNQWLKLLSTHGLILNTREALDWSGRGQHAQYSPEEEASIPLKSQGNLGFGASGFVDRVKCRRIVLARKTIACIRNITKEEAAKEVGHLQRLQHQHIVRLVGTYTLKKKLSILTYPATNYNLAEFLDHVHDELTSSNSSVFQSPSEESWLLTLYKVMGCLANALEFIHGQSTKHMDIKPTNILVDCWRNVTSAKVYITDFGTSRSYQSTEASFTDSPISFTRIYAAPEVAQQITRGPPADIFSLGSVFMEIMATLLSTPEDSQQERLQQIRNEGADVSYQANIERIVEWYETQKEEAARFFVSSGVSITHHRRLVNLLPTMLAVSPEARPTAAELWHCAKGYACKACDSGPEPFKAA